MTQEEGTLLLKVARSAIESHLRRAHFSLPKTVSQALREKRGAFVTLHSGGRLRGCIGRVIPTEPLMQTVSLMAAEAAFNDPRFLPLTPEELPGVSLEVSVLSPLRRLRNPQEIEVGKTGLLIQKGPSSGLLLPQVAQECHWTREEFLTQTCHKAGLPGEAWKEKGIEIFGFQAEIFSEEGSNG